MERLRPSKHCRESLYRHSNHIDIWLLRGESAARRLSMKTEREGAIVFRAEPVLRLAETKLRGAHNIENLMATLAVGLTRGLSFEQMVPPLRDYNPRPHRLEFIRSLGGVDYINDSKATNLHAVEKALHANPPRAVFLIQKEVAQRLTARPGTRDYGYLTVQTAVFASVRTLFDVKPGARMYLPPDQRVRVW